MNLLWLALSRGRLRRDRGVRALGGALFAYFHGGTTYPRAIGCGMWIAGAVTVWLVGRIGKYESDGGSIADRRRRPVCLGKRHTEPQSPFILDSGWNSRGRPRRPDLLGWVAASRVGECSRMSPEPSSRLSRRGATTRDVRGIWSLLPRVRGAVGTRWLCEAELMRYDAAAGDGR